MKNGSLKNIFDKIYMAGKEAANIIHLICQMLWVSSNIYLDASQNNMFEGMPKRMIAYNGLLFHDSHRNWELPPNHATLCPRIARRQPRNSRV